MPTDNGAFCNTFKVLCFAGIMPVVALADQLTKLAAADTIEAPFSFVGTHIGAPAVIFGPLAVLGLLCVLVLLRKLWTKWPLLALPVSLIAAGALSNIAEAAVQGGVTDFIRVGPIATNIADLAVMDGVLGLLLMVIYICACRRCYPAGRSAPRLAVVGMANHRRRRGPDSGRD